jgi:hypothetical protein
LRSGQCTTKHYRAWNSECCCLACDFPARTYIQQWKSVSGLSSKGFPPVKGVGISVGLKQDLCKTNVVGLGSQVQQIAVLELDVVFPDAGLQSDIKVCA